MQPFVTLTGIAAPLAVANVDTDQIIPARFLKTLTRSGLGKSLFAGLRYHPDGSENPDFVLNQEPFRKAEILISLDNFGCGSSREHAPWALADFGIRCVIAPSFADIFYNNCFKNGILPVALPRAVCEQLLEETRLGSNARVTVDLERQVVVRAGGEEVAFEIDAGLRNTLLQGLDEISETLEHDSAISRFEDRRTQAEPWRPAIVFDPLVDASTLKPDVVRGLDIMIVRESTGGVYFGEPRGIETLANGVKRGVNTEVYDTIEIERVARVAFELAQVRGKRLCSVEKANVMESGLLWRQTVTALAPDYPDVALSHMYADNCAMQLVRNPRQFDVIVTGNLFGDLLSDLASMLTGSLGMLPSATLGAPDVTGKRASLYEPIHGSAPDIAGKGLANPLAQILSLAMMLRYSLNRPEDAATVEAAVVRALNNGARTADIGGKLSTTDMGDAVLEALG